MSYDVGNTELVLAISSEAKRVLPSLMEKVVRPWVDGASLEILYGRTLSAGPSRSGKNVQVRFRLGPRLAVSCHDLDRLRGANGELAPPEDIFRAIRGRVTISVVRADKVEEKLRTSLKNSLIKFCKSVPDDLVAKADPTKNKPLYWDSLIRGISYDHVQGLNIRSLVLAADGVQAALDRMVARASELIVLIPHHLFPDTGRRLDHSNAKRKLLKAMKAALAAGMTDSELEEVKNKALVYQIMS